MQTTTNGLSEMPPKATLKIDKSTLESLKMASRSMDDTYDAVICRLLNDRLTVMRLKEDQAQMKKDLETLPSSTDSKGIVWVTLRDVKEMIDR